MEVLFESEVRTESLILLKEENKDLSTLRTQLGVQAQTLSPHLKLLKDYHLIRSHSDTYELTTIGRLLAEKLVSLIDALDKAESMEDHAITSGSS
ncbi:hypothetical protein [Methanolobus halotolerans]|uniref:HVO-A0261-like N-terminal domain-containing protein n=2 Tax=Methanolobus halotolerans TaxID=2052935 RepID=A0A4E0Q620_9EURY|nr:hypothetical protein CUN85_06300 [Methanolobus halotolerans]